MAPAAEFAPLTLSNTCEGNLEDQFQLALEEIADVFENADQYETDKSGTIRTSITLEIEIVRQRESAMLSIDTRAKVKRPKRRRVGRSVFYQAGVFTAPVFTQTDMFIDRTNVHPMPIASAEDSQG